MSKQRLQALEAQYNACAMQQEEALKTNQAVIAEVRQKENQIQLNESAKNNVGKQLISCTGILVDLNNSNKSLSSNIAIEKAKINNFTSLLSQYNEYIPPIQKQCLINDNNANVEKAGELAAFINANN